ncbi:MAG: hypothetical protein KC503_32000 [Myxococcales bacterium]|nr:hypothetical protein [Myxococcales bacterium]
MKRASTLLVVLIVAVLPCGCGGDDGPAPSADRTSRVSVGEGDGVTIPERFLSVAVDTAQVVGGLFWNPDGSSGTVGDFPVPPYDFARPRLRALAKALAPALLRVGGTDADHTYYDLDGTTGGKAPAGFEWVLTKAQWDGVADFARALDYRILFTLNAGKGPRDQSDVWQGDNARSLVEYSVANNVPVDVWELGNEVNGYSVLLGFFLQPQQYGADLAAARALIDAAAPGAKLAAPAIAYWPKAGEFNNYFGQLMAVGPHPVDIVTWHYYPQQSRRCPLATRRARAEVMLDPQNLDEASRWAAEVEAHTKKGAPGAAVWLGESGNAQCGGEPGVSDAFAGSFWWIDQLGVLAARGQGAVVRQTLSGSDYGLIDDQTLEPRPDYWASLLWRRLVGTRVLSAKSDDTKLRAYAHCRRQGDGVTVVLLNVDTAKSVRVDLDGALGDTLVRYTLTAASLDAKVVALEGVELKLASDDTLPALDGVEQRGTNLVMPAASIAFVELPQAGVAACK